MVKTKKKLIIKRNKTLKKSTYKKKLIDKALNYGKKLVGIKYACWQPSMGLPKKDGPPFWIKNAKPPNIKIIKKEGMCCTGLPNLIRRYLGLEIPGHISGEKKLNFIGGTGEWFGYLKKKKRLKKNRL